MESLLRRTNKMLRRIRNDMFCLDCTINNRNMKFSFRINIWEAMVIASHDLCTNDQKHLFDSSPWRLGSSSEDGWLLNVLKGVDSDITISLAPMDNSNEKTVELSLNEYILLVDSYIRARARGESFMLCICYQY